MIVCSCNVISDHDVRDVVVSTGDELCSAAQVYDCLGCSVHCGRCARSVRRILREHALCVTQDSIIAEATPEF